MEETKELLVLSGLPWPIFMGQILADRYSVRADAGDTIWILMQHEVATNGMSAR